MDVFQTTVSDDTLDWNKWNFINAKVHLSSLYDLTTLNLNLIASRIFQSRLQEMIAGFLSLAMLDVLCLVEDSVFHRYMCIYIYIYIYIYIRAETNIRIVWVFARLQHYSNTHWIFKSKILVSCEYTHAYS